MAERISSASAGHCWLASAAAVATLDSAMALVAAVVTVGSSVAQALALDENSAPPMLFSRSCAERGGRDKRAARGAPVARSLVVPFSFSFSTVAHPSEVARSTEAPYDAPNAIAARGTG